MALGPNKNLMHNKNLMRRGFTLIELLIVIAIISIIAAVVFVALDPLARFQDSRDAKRWADISGILSAVKIDQVDNGGSYMTNVANMIPNEVYMVTDGVATDCTTAASTCDVPVTVADHCVNLAELVTQGYLGTVPLSPKGVYAWDKNKTGYTIEKSSTGILTVRACEAERATEIKASR